MFELLHAKKMEFEEFAKRIAEVTANDKLTKFIAVAALWCDCNDRTMSSFVNNVDEDVLSEQERVIISTLKAILKSLK